MVRRHEIGLEEIKGIRIGQAENTDAGTGCTVFLSDQGMTAGLDVRGGGPASRESELLNPLAAAQVIHGIVLAGGSAFGLNAAEGVMQYLEEREIGFDVGLPVKVPLVCQSDLFDLTVGDPYVRPDKEMGYAACLNSENGGNYRDGNYGAGCGATVGKFAGNTTIGVVITNAAFDKTRLCKIAGMAHDGYARSIRPVHTSADGDSIYAVSVGNVTADMDLTGTMAAEVMSEAITRAVKSAKSAYGFPAAEDLKKQA